MLMPLLSPAAGRIAFRLPEGAVLSAGDLIARLELDDAGACQRGACVAPRLVRHSWEDGRKGWHCAWRSGVPPQASEPCTWDLSGQ